MTDDRAYRVVLPGSRTAWPCSPRPPETAGIVLSAPASVPFGGRGDATDEAFARMIVCGAYRFPSNYLGLRERFVGRMLLVAVDAASHRAFAGPVTPAGEDPGPDPYAGLGISDADLEGQSVGGWFNPNVAEVMPLPERDATYWVYATLGEHVSNVVRIELAGPATVRR